MDIVCSNCTCGFQNHLPMMRHERPSVLKFSKTFCLPPLFFAFFLPFLSPFPSNLKLFAPPKKLVWVSSRHLALRYEELCVECNRRGHSKAYCTRHIAHRFEKRYPWCPRMTYIEEVPFCLQKGISFQYPLMPLSSISEWRARWRQYFLWSVI